MGLTCARSCLRRGEADARMTRFPRIMLSAGRFNGRGARGPAGRCWGGAGAAVGTATPPVES